MLRSMDANSSMNDAPRIVITVADPGAQADVALAERKNGLYAEAVARQRGIAVLLHAATPRQDRIEAFRTMDGLLLAGGADIDPRRYNESARGAVDVEPERDALEAEAWAAAMARDLPVLGICRGLQAMNVFMGGRLLQDVARHAGSAYGTGRALTHPLRVVPGSRLARILFPTNVRGGVVAVNTYHHQGVRAGDVAAGLAVGAWASSPAGDLAEAIETTSGPFRLAVQCHPERTGSTPDAFERLFRVFVDASRGSVTARSATGSSR